MKLNKRHKTTIYVLGRIHDLISEELLLLPNYLTVKGISLYDQMMADGFKPDKEIVREIVEVLYDEDIYPYDTIVDMVINND